MSVAIKNIEQLPTVQELILEGVEANNPGKSQRELAIEMGLASDGVSMLSMLKNGKVKLKLGRVGKAASVLKLDPTTLLLSALKERVGEDDQAWEAVRKVFNSVHSEHEHLAVQAIRDVELETGKELVFSNESLTRFKKFLKEEMTI